MNRFREARRIVGRSSSRWSFSAQGSGSSNEYSILNDPDLVAWYDAKSSTITQADATERVSVWSDLSGHGYDLVQATAANQPILLPDMEVNYLSVPGIASNYASSPDSAAVSLSGDQSIAARVSLKDWTPSANAVIWAHFKNTVNRRGVLLYITTDGKLHFLWSANGTDFSDKASTVANTITDGASAWIMATFDVDNGAAGNDIKFYTAPDSASLPTTWTQLGATVTTAGVASVFDTINQITIGTDEAGTDAPQKIFRTVYLSGVVASDGTGGTIVFDADFTAVPEGATSFVESSSNAATVTINTSGATPAQIVAAGQPSLLWNGAAYWMQTGAITIPAPYFIAETQKALSWTSGAVAFDGRTANSFALQQITGSPQVRLHDGGADSTTVSPTLSTYYVVTAGQAADGAGTLRLNLGTATTATMSATGLGGITECCDGSGTLTFWNGQKKSKLVYAAIPAAADQERLVRYLAVMDNVTLS